MTDDLAQHSRAGKLFLTSSRLLLVRTSAVPQPPLLEVWLGTIWHLSADLTPPSCNWLAQRHRRSVRLGDADAAAPFEGWPTLQLRLRSGGVVLFAFWAGGRDSVAWFLECLIRPRQAIALHAPETMSSPCPSPPASRFPDVCTLVYNDFKRMGVYCGEGTPPAEGWRLEQGLNRNFEFSPTYARLFAVPAAATTETLLASAKFRSKARLPVLSWLCPRTGLSITRCSQPLTGMLSRRCVEDERLVELIRTSPRGSDPDPILYILDLRPYTNAMANRCKGGGHEMEGVYMQTRVVHEKLENMHVIAGSLDKLQGLALSGPDGKPLLAEGPSVQDEKDRLFVQQTDGQARDPYLQQLHETNWVQYINLLIKAALDVVKIIHAWSKPVLLHCSDGWDRTPQISSLAQILLDPFYRTFDGFATLVEKEWVAMGHKFRSRNSGLRLACSARMDPRGTVGTAGSHPTAARPSEIGGVIVEGIVEGMLGGEFAPIFLQWLATVANIVNQLPEAFEFSESLLRQLAVHHSSGLFENFLGDSQKEREALRRAAEGDGVGHRYRSCFWRAMREELWLQVRNDAYDPQAYPRELTADDIDTSSRRLTPWVLQSDGSVAAEERSRKERLARQLRDERNRVVRAQREETQRNMEQLEAELAVERERRAMDARELAEERMRRAEDARRLEEMQREKDLLHRKYTEDVGHAPVDTREAHPGGGRAALRPVFDPDSTQPVLVQMPEEMPSVEVLDESVVLVSHIKQTPAPPPPTAPVPRPQTRNERCCDEPITARFIDEGYFARDRPRAQVTCN
eukprot:Hpha_TRINITY_DN16124_c2_g1::TRINITY_DN16124_c2_g1_i2::g.3245::m.3245/K18083/MTMR6_7_8; myotubularin-related protein 6/7/8